MNELEKQLGLSASTLIGVSKFDSSRSVHLNRNRIYKIVDSSRDTVQGTRVNTLENEAKILTKLSGKNGIPQNANFGSLNFLEYLEYDYMEGKRIEDACFRSAQKIAILLKLAAILVRLSAAGVAHRDINQSNVIRRVDGRLTLVDFDQAIETTVTAAFASNFFGHSSGAPRGHGSFWTFTKSLISAEKQAEKLTRFEAMKQLKQKLSVYLPEFVVHKYRRVILKRERVAQKKKREAYLEIPTVPPDSAESLHLIREAWLEAKYSKSNTPGFDIAYYALAVDGYHFPGERPWAQRWSYLRDAVDLEGKRILELGCNLGLLSCFALKKANAKAAFCVDSDYRILSAAQKVAGAFHVQPAFKRVNFDSEVAWEEELMRFAPDVVFALNVLNWVGNKERMLNFLSQFDLIVYEGHDSLDLEIARFLSLGFKQIDVVAVSERKREVLRISR